MAIVVRYILVTKECHFCVWVLLACMVPVEARRVCQIPTTGGQKTVVSSMQLLRAEPKSVGEPSALKHSHHSSPRPLFVDILLPFSEETICMFRV